MNDVLLKNTLLSTPNLRTTSKDMTGSAWCNHSLSFSKHSPLIGSYILVNHPECKKKEREWLNLKLTSDATTWSNDTT